VAACGAAVFDGGAVGDVVVVGAVVLRSVQVSRLACSVQSLLRKRMHATAGMSAAAAVGAVSAIMVVTVHAGGMTTAADQTAHFV